MAGNSSLVWGLKFIMNTGPEVDGKERETQLQKSINLYRALFVNATDFETRELNTTVSAALTSFLFVA